MSDLADQIEAFLAINATGKVSHPTPGLAVELLEKALQSLRSQSLSTQQPIGEPMAYEVTDKLTSFEHNRVRYIGADDNWLPSARLDTQRFSLRPLYALHPNQESGE